MLSASVYSQYCFAYRIPFTLWQNWVHCHNLVTNQLSKYFSVSIFSSFSDECLVLRYFETVLLFLSLQLLLCKLMCLNVFSSFVVTWSIRYWPEERIMPDLFHHTCVFLEWFFIRLRIIRINDSFCSFNLSVPIRIW